MPIYTYIYLYIYIYLCACNAPPHVLGPPRPPRPLGRRPRGPRTWGRGMGAAHCMRMGIYIYIVRYIYIWVYINIYKYI